MSVVAGAESTVVRIVCVVDEGFVESKDTKELR
jgi:hypothetical protein